MEANLPEIRVRASIHQSHLASYVPDDPAHPVRGGTIRVAPLYMSRAGHFAVVPGGGMFRFALVHVPTGRFLPRRWFGEWAYLPSSTPGALERVTLWMAADKRKDNHLRGVRVPSRDELDELNAWAAQFVEASTT